MSNKKCLWEATLPSFIKRIDPQFILGWRVILALVVLLLWEFNPEILGINAFWLSRPSLVLEAAGMLHSEGSLLPHVWVTLLETALGLGLGCFVGIALGIFFGSSRLLREIFEPFLLVANAFPKIAMAPLFLIWFGIGLEMKVAVAFSLVVVVMILSTYSGVILVRQELVNNARLMGANQLQIFFKIVLPSIVPWLFAGLKISIAFALVGAVLGEFIAAQNGIGFLIDDGMANFESALVFLGLVLLLIIVWLINSFMEAVGRWFRIEETTNTAAYNT